MAKRDNFKSVVRDTLIANSNIRPTSSSPSIIRTVDKNASMNAAIEARRAELQGKQNESR